MEDKTYRVIKKKSLAEALNFLGFRYFKYQGEDGNFVYSFEETESFIETIEKLLKLKKETMIMNK